MNASLRALSSGQAARQALRSSHRPQALLLHGSLSLWPRRATSASRSWPAPSMIGWRTIVTTSTPGKPRHSSSSRQQGEEQDKRGDEQDKRARQQEVRRPWVRQDADKPAADESADKQEQLKKGRLLTTPTRLLKLIVPLPLHSDSEASRNSSHDEKKALHPLALLIHPQQPLSYVERLIQAELPPVVRNGKEAIPNIYFRAEDTTAADDDDKTRARSATNQRSASGGSASSHVASYSGLGREGPELHPDDKRWIRWSGSTEMGDFIRDAARGREFAIEVEGHGAEVRVSVPSFNDRTYYMRDRLRKMSAQLDAMAGLKEECDQLAHRGAHRLAKGGFVLLLSYSGLVSYFTFLTDYGWDLMEPITYIVGLATIMGGYLWFLYISRDLSYKAAMNVTVTRRQNALYEARGFDVQQWEQLVHECNALRREIATIAAEYDVDWDDGKDMSDEVKEMLDGEKDKAKAKKREGQSEGNDDDGNDGDDGRQAGKGEKGDGEKSGFVETAK